MAFQTAEKANAYFRKRYRENVLYVQALKVASGCADCGYDEHHAALEFDHVKPRIRGTVASQMGKSRRVIDEEIAQCEVVCGNCHSIRTYTKNGGAWRPPKQPGGIV